MSLSMSLLPHRQNLEAKIKENYKGMASFFESFMQSYYNVWHKRNMNLKGASKTDILKRVNWFEKYLEKIDHVNEIEPPQGKNKNWITPQSKFRPSALEEFIYYILKDIPAVHSLGLKFTNKKVFAGMSIDHNGRIIIKGKDVDVALVKEEKISFDKRKSIRIAVPVVAIEVKTYVDKTMWNEAQYTAQIIKHGNPECKVYLIAETNAVKIEELLPESPVNEVFILRKDSNAKIDRDTVFEFVNEIKNSLEKIQKRPHRKPPGRLLHPI